MLEADCAYCLVTRLVGPLVILGLGRVEEQPRGLRGANVEDERAIRTDGNAAGHRGADGEVGCASVELLRKVVSWALEGLTTRKKPLTYLAKVHGLDTFTSKRRTDWRTGTRLACADDELHHLVKARGRTLF